MLIRNTNLIAPDFHLLTVGESCFYLISSEEAVALFDCGPSILFDPLLKRSESLEGISKKLDFIFLTGIDPVRMGALPYFKKKFPGLKIVASTETQESLTSVETKKMIYEQDKKYNQLFQFKGQDELDCTEYCSLLEVDRIFPHTETFHFMNHIDVRCISTVGHSQASTAYLVAPYQMLIADQSLGYYRMKDLAAPGADECLQDSITSIEQFDNIELSTLCLPFTGALTGALARDYLTQLKQNTSDLLEEARKAFKKNTPGKEIKKSIHEAFFSPVSEDPLYQEALKTTAATVWEQLERSYGKNPS